MDENIILGFLILASITVFIISLYILIPALKEEKKFRNGEVREKKFRSLTLSRDSIKNKETLGTELNKA
ncbi:MAG: hypothetical protein HKN89_08705 [Eudoraea sp.]|nr:hypothetical protein [Eudoraea sp.]